MKDGTPGDWSEDLIPVDSARTLDGLFVQRVRRSPDRVAYRSFDKQTKTWRDSTWAETAAQVARWRDALAGESLTPGDRVAVLLRNGKDWVHFDQASLASGLVVVPLYTDDRPENAAYILEDAEVGLLLVQDAGRWRHLAAVLEGNHSLRRVLILADDTEARQLALDDERVVCAPDWLPSSASELEPRGDGRPDDLASIVYTSGTTGRPKGVMLSHHNMLSIAHASIITVDCYQQDVLLSFLPLSHTLERTAGYYLPIMAGATVAYSRSVVQLADDLLQVRPTVLIAVPRIFERFHARLVQPIGKVSRFRRVLFELTERAGWRRFERQQGRARWSPMLPLWPLLRRLVADKVIERLGGRIRVVVSGGAPLSPEVAKLFLAMGLPLLQGYGLTETSPVLSVNPIDDNDPASVGVPLRGVEVGIGRDDELLVKSPGIMLGYWNNHAATARMIDSEGWLHTGDQARIQDRHIYITGRIKDIVVLSNGEKVSPGDMELALLLDPLFEQVMIVGEGRAFLSALAVLNADLWPGFAQDQGLDPLRPESITDPHLLSALQRRMADALRDFPGYAKVRKVSPMLEPWTVDNGLLTPTLKVKRPQVLERYAERIDAIYQEGRG